MTLLSLAELLARAQAWVARLEEGGVKARVVELCSVTGGGTFAGEEIPSAGLAIDGSDPDALLAALRRAEPPVLARIEEGVVVCDARTVLPGEDDALLASVRSALSSERL
jgi:L-seryl-tRNA(Ser) seleniumtransferase